MDTKHILNKIRYEIDLQLCRTRFGFPGPKVFCVGLHKTGTTSLGKALHILGYRVAGPFDICRTENRSTTMNTALKLTAKFDAFQDVPWAYFFAEFDQLYPDAKFILTTRKSDEWYESVLKHFGDQIINVHTMFYGVEKARGNKDQYIAYYNKHTDFVRKHFENRSDKLLEIDISSSPDWYDLCKFLSKREPTCRFPHLNTEQHRAVVG